MPLIRDEDEERRARVDQMIADLKQARDSAARQIEHAKQTIARSRNTMKRVDATSNGCNATSASVRCEIGYY